MPYLLGLIYWGACRLSKLLATSKMKGCKIDRIELEIHVISSFGFHFVSVCTSTHGPLIAPNPPKLGGIAAQ